MLAAGDQLRPSELQRTLSLRLRNLRTAVARSSHSMQVLFAVHTPAEVECVKKAMGGQREAQCMQVTEHVLARSEDSSYYKLFN